ncbi:MAG: methylthioribulose 1-phosphate dehydratase [Bacteriovoracaceae bacterium]
MFTALDHDKLNSLIDCIKFFASKGWTPATSTNYSFRSSQFDQFIISRSGVDKTLVQKEDFLIIDIEGKILKSQKLDAKSSAETEIHTEIYRRFPDAHCVLHTHSILGTILSHAFAQEKKIVFQDLEILKGLEGNVTHEMSETLPIVPNSQNISEINAAMAPHYEGPIKIHGFLIAGHGLYTWGRDIASAKRHIETFEFLLDCFYHLRRL